MRNYYKLIVSCVFLFRKLMPGVVIVNDYPVQVAQGRKSGTEAFFKCQERLGELELDLNQVPGSISGRKLTILGGNYQQGVTYAVGIYTDPNGNVYVGTQDKTSGSELVGIVTKNGKALNVNNPAHARDIEELKKILGLNSQRSMNPETENNTRENQNQLAGVSTKFGAVLSSSIAPQREEKAEEIQLA
jgi:hypothetical protein